MALKARPPLYLKPFSSAGSSSSKSFGSSNMHLNPSIYKSISPSTRSTSPSPSLVKKKYIPHPPGYLPSNKTSSVAGKSSLPARIYQQNTSTTRSIRRPEAPSSHDRSPQQHSSSTKPPPYPRECIDSGSTRRDSVGSSGASTGSAVLHSSYMKPGTTTTSQLHRDRDDSYLRTYAVGENLTKHDSSVTDISASRERRRQMKRTISKDYTAAIETRLPTVNSNSRLSSSVGECLNYVGLHSSPQPAQNKVPAFASSQRTHLSRESSFGRELGTDRSADGRSQAFLGSSINSPTSEKSTPRASPSPPYTHQILPKDRLHTLLSSTRKSKD